MTLGRGSYEEKLPKRFSLLSPVAAPPICPHGENTATTGGPCKHFGIWRKGRGGGRRGRGGGEEREEGSSKELGYNTSRVRTTAAEEAKRRS